MPMLGALNGSFRPGLQKSPPSGTHSPAGHHPCDFTAVQAGDVVLPRNPPRSSKICSGKPDTAQPIGFRVDICTPAPKSGPGFTSLSWSTDRSNQKATCSTDLGACFGSDMCVLSWTRSHEVPGARLRGPGPSTEPWWLWGFLLGELQNPPRHGHPAQRAPCWGWGWTRGTQRCLQLDQFGILWFYFSAGAAAIPTLPWGPPLTARPRSSSIKAKGSRV